MKSLIASLLILSCVVSPVTASAWGQAGAPPLVESLRVKPPLDFCGEQIPLDNREVCERFEKELLLALWDRPQVILWIKRSHRYLPRIERMLKDNGMPDDLKYLALIESALRPHIGSPKGAMGFWQFTEATGIKYGLRIDADIDERRSVVASTRAAIRCFREFHDIFGSWTLAAAAFNMGKEGLRTDMLVQKTVDYYHLYLPLETQRYVPRIIAAKLILNDPDHYGFHLSKGDLYPPRTVDRVTVECPEKIPLRIVAEAAGTHFKVVKDLNPEIRGYYLIQGGHTLSIPKGTSKGFHARYDELMKQWLAEKDHYVYVVKEGDNLSVIADRFGVPLPALFLWNNLDLGKPIHPGDRLVIHPPQKP